MRYNSQKDYNIDDQESVLSDLGFDTTKKGLFNVLKVNKLGSNIMARRQEMVTQKPSMAY